MRTCSPLGTAVLEGAEGPIPAGWAGLGRQTPRCPVRISKPAFDAGTPEAVKREGEPERGWGGGKQRAEDPPVLGPSANRWYPKC